MSDIADFFKTWHNGKWFNPFKSPLYGTDLKSWRVRVRAEYRGVGQSPLLSYDMTLTCDACLNKWRFAGSTTPTADGAWQPSVGTWQRLWNVVTCSDECREFVENQRNDPLFSGPVRPAFPYSMSPR